MRTIEITNVGNKMGIVFLFSARGEYDNWVTRDKYRNIHVPVIAPAGNRYTVTDIFLHPMTRDYYAVCHYDTPRIYTRHLGLNTYDVFEYTTWVITSSYYNEVVK